MKRMILDLPEDVAHELKVYAVQNDIPMKKIVSDLIIEFIKIKTQQK